MGFGRYSREAHEEISRARTGKSREEVFAQRTCHALMNPLGAKARESRDSPDHPLSFGIVFALDVTGSMGHIPDLLARKQLPTFMDEILSLGVADPQLLFMAVGDATCDRAPLQVGQFESEAKLMDQWLTWSYLEGGGGGSNMESYELAMYFAARHTAMDCWKKRKKRGYFFMTGDELPYPRVARLHVEKLIGDGLEDDVPTERAVAALRETFEPFFLVPDLARRARCERAWRDLLGDRVVCMESADDTCHVAAGIIALGEGAVKDLDAFAGQLAAKGVASDRVGAIVRALTPLASSVGKDGVPPAKLEDVPLTSSDGASGMKRA